MESCQGTKIGALIPYKKMIIKNGKKKRCFLFSYVYITSLMYRKYIGSFSLIR